MGEQEGIQLVTQAYDAFGKGDIPALLALCADDIDWRIAKISNVPFSGQRRGKEEVAAFFRQLDENQHPLQFEPREYIAQGDKVVALGHYAWSVKSTDRRFESDWAHVFTIRNGKIAGFQEYTDTAATAAAYQEPGPDIAI